MTLAPGGPGLNTFDIVIRRNDAPVNDALVKMQVVSPSRDWRGIWTEVPAAEAALYVAASNEMDREGRWLTLLDISLPGAAVQRAAFAWDISEAAAVPTALDADLLNWLALLGVLAAVAWALWPLARRLYRWLDWRPASVATAGAAVAMTIFFMGMSIVVTNQSEANYQAQIYPPPQVVNSVLPDAQSLALGQQLYEQYCKAWQAPDLGFQALVERLPQSRDEELFRAVQTGWHELPACADTLSDEQRWHIVNYLRSLAE